MAPPVSRVKSAVSAPRLEEAMPTTRTHLGFLLKYALDHPCADPLRGISLMSKREMLVPAVLGSLTCLLLAGCPDEQPPATNQSPGTTNNQTNGETPCPEGSQGCACYANNTCDGALTCEANVCVESTCPQGSESCLCYGNDTCDGELTCELGRCRVPEENPNNTMMCEPTRTECPDDACGMVDNGCGEMLDCGACACTDGVPSSPTCGFCGLGVASCEEGATESTCTQPVADALVGLPDAYCQNTLYVDAAADPDAADGSHTAPFAHVYRAVEAAQPDSLILVRQGDYTGERQFTIDHSLVILGGLDQDWRPTSDAFSKLVVSHLPIPDHAPVERAFSINIEQVGDAPVVLSGLEVWAGDSISNSIEGRDNYVVRIFESNGVVMERVVLRGALAGDGKPGREGDRGLDGQDATAPTYHTAYINDTLMPANRNGGLAGIGGINTMGERCENSRGGNGGLGGHTLTSMALVEPTAGETSPIGALGGGAGVASAVSKFGRDGESGFAATPGADGTGGSPQGDAIIMTGWWLAPNADGQAGEPGTAGSGGGGGGGAWWPGDDRGIDDAPGSSGGGGGAGGCGGGGAVAGTGGGSNFIVFAVNSNPIILRDIRIYGGFGGHGGEGATGGDGGMGGEGSGPAHDYDAAPSTGTMFFGTDYPANMLGGTGGDGAPGGQGGSSGGGAGGHAITMYCSGASITLQGENDITVGGVGVGGNAPVNKGLTGEQIEQLNCY